MPTIELQVYGKVQGVFYRASAQKKAAGWGLTGWVRNMPDGSVLLQASGPETVLDLLESWCYKGPDGAEVVRVEKRRIAELGFPDFRVIR